MILLQYSHKYITIYLGTIDFTNNNNNNNNLILFLMLYYVCTKRVGRKSGSV